MPPLTIGTATARFGEIVAGWFHAVSLPTGGSDQLPVLIAQGKEADGPVMWVTTGIHGGEHTGLIALHDLITPDLVSRLRGTLVAIPALSPGGLRTKQRLPYYLQTDPNRLFPAPGKEIGGRDNGGTRDKPGSEVEETYRFLYECIVESEPACLFDLHNAWFGSMPYAFRDPVFYRKGRAPGLSRGDAQKLLKRVSDLLEVLGLTIVNEFVADDYVSKNLHRSVSGSVLNGAGIPAATLELGSWMHVDRGIVEACCAGLRNVMRALDMLPGEMEAIEGVPVIRPGYPVRRHVHPYAPTAGIVHHLARPGDAVRTGQPLARLTDIFGGPAVGEDGLLRSEYDGFVMGWHHGVVVYRGDPIMDLAIPDEGELVVPYPD
jgi:predicted deacylase